HELLRQFAAEKLEQAAERETIHRTHSRYYLALLAAEETQLVGPEQYQSVVRLREDAPNLSVAWLAAAEQGDWSPVRECLKSFEHYWSITGMHAEGRRLVAVTAERLAADLAQASVVDSRVDGVSRERGMRTLLARLKLTEATLLRSHAPISTTQEILHAALALATQPPECDPDLIGQISLALSSTYSHQGRRVEAETHLNRAYHLLQDSNDYALQAKFYVELSGQKSDIHQRLAMLKKAVALAEQSGDLTVDFFARGFLVYVQTRWGDFSEMRHHLAVLLHKARLLQNVVAEARAFNFYGGFYFQIGNFVEMAHYNARAMAVVQKTGDPMHLGLLYGRLALHALFSEDAEQAVVFAQQGIDTGVVNRHLDLQAISSCLLGRAHVLAGDLDAGWQAFHRTMQILDAHGRTLAYLPPVLGQATIRLRQGHATAARAMIDPYLPAILNGNLNTIIDYEHVYADVYRILRAVGDPCARQVLARAHAVFSRIAATIPEDQNRQSYWRSNPARRFVEEGIGRLGD
ncbi:MAG: hypothetical protein KDD84_19755, partial [Caldilineaceae bacterium]|nr:hypothetical protein [Caldilineaceae bacterium]